MRGYAYLMILFFSVGISACAEKIPVPPPVIVNACPTVKFFSKEQQQAIKNAKNDLPGASPLPEVVIDWARMRAEARACAKK